MTDKEKVLAKWPGAEAWQSKAYGFWLIDVPTEIPMQRRALPNCSGTTESEAWANAAKGLE